MNQSVTSVVGIILQDFDPRPPRYSLEESMRTYMRSPDVSKSAKDLLEKASPSRCRSDRSETQLVIVEGHQLPKDPHSEAIRRLAEMQGYKQPSLEDAIRIFPIISFDELSPKITSLWVMHHPVDNEVLGFTLVDGFVKLSAHKAEPREGWFCETCGFIFRCS